jgi:hypothetical protein
MQKHHLIYLVVVVGIFVLAWHFNKAQRKAAQQPGQ